MDSLTHRLAEYSKDWRIRAADAGIVQEAIEALKAYNELYRAVCGETGFANAVRVDSGHAYPWPALDDAEAKLSALLSSKPQKGEK